MEIVALEKVTQPTALEVCKFYDVADESQEIITDSVDPAEFSSGIAHPCNFYPLGGI